MKSLSGVQKIVIATAVVLLAGGIYFFYQSGASTFLNVTLNTNPDLNRGLVLHYTFDGADMDWSSTTAEVRDTSGNTHNGNATTSMTATTSPASGVVGQALTFNGSRLDRIDTGSNLLESGAVSVAAWIKPTYWDDYHSILHSYNTYMSLRYYSGELVWDNDNNLSQYASSGANTIRLNEWQHVAGVRAADGTVTLYINGAQSGAAGQTAGTVSSNAWNTYVGARYDGGYPFYGSVDDVRVYNRALSATEVKRLYQVGATTKMGQTLTNPTLDSGLVAHWTFDGADMDWSSTTGEVRDVSGNGYTLTSQFSMSRDNVVAGTLGQALTFDGANTYLVYPDPGRLPVPSQYTLSAWMKPSAYTTGTGDFIDTGNPGVGGYYFAIDSSGRLDVNNDFSVLPSRHTSVESIPLNTWTHVVATWTGGTSGSNIHLYINGTETSYGTTDNGSGTMTGINTLVVAGCCGPKVSGAIDDMRIYNRALSAAEVKRLYQIGATTKINDTLNMNPNLNSGLVGWWTFDGQYMDWSSTTGEVRDRSGNGYTLTSASTMTRSNVVPGPLGQGLQFNGIDQDLRVTGGTHLPTPTQYTVSAWINPNQYTTGNGDFIDTGDPGIGGYWLGVDNLGRLITHTVFTVADSARRSTASIPLNTWTHVTATWTGGTASSSIHIYANGVEVSYGYAEEGSGTMTGVNALVIGSCCSKYKMALDDVRIYSRALSADEVKRLYELGR